MPEDARTMIEHVYGPDSEAGIPAGFARNLRFAEGKERGEESLALLNALKLDVGYKATGMQWADDAYTPTRLGEPTVTLRLAVVNNSKFVRGRKRATENIERYCLEPYGMKRLDAGHYELTIPYRSDDELDKSVHDLLTEISQEADMRNCFVEMGAWEEDTEKRW